MKYGIYISNYGQFGNCDNLINIAKAAEKSRWDGIFLWDHINPSKKDVEVVDPWIALTSMASETSRIKLGTTITPIPRRRPRKLARETTSLDHYSKGRLILGAGLGTPNEEEFGIFAEETNRKIRGQMLDEGLEVLNGLWSGENFEFDGEYYQIKKPVKFLPKTYQEPRIPIWAGGFWNYKNFKPFRRAAQWDGCIPILSQMKGKKRIEVYHDIYNYIKPHRDNMEGFDLVMIQSMRNKEAKSLKKELDDDKKISWWLDTIYNFYNKSMDKILEVVNKGPEIK